MKLKAFTLIELMVTLAIFSIAMLTITGILSLGMKNLELYSRGSYSHLPVILFSKVLENILINSYDVSLNSNGNYEIQSFTNIRYEVVVSISNKEIQLIEYDGIKKPRPKVFKMEKMQSADFKFIQQNGRNGLDLRIDLKGSVFERYFLLGYKRKEAEL